MAAQLQSQFRQRFCRNRDCQALFFICSHCDRGQCYCSQPCRQICRARQLREANRRHRQSVEGRLDHRDHQRAYRLRKTIQAGMVVRVGASSVRDHGSPGISTSVTIGRGSIRPMVSTRQTASRGLFELILDRPMNIAVVVCRFCGRIGSFINPFYAP